MRLPPVFPVALVTGVLLASVFVDVGSAGPFDLQRTWLGEAVGDQFGVAAAAAGDINGDGFDDLVVGANVNDHLVLSGGRAYVFLGGLDHPLSPSLSYAGDLERGYVGGAVAGGGDLNGDGFDDWVVGAPGPGPDGLNPGRVEVFFGGASPDAVPDMTLVGTVAGGQFGAALCLLPDFDGDGFADLAIGSPRAGNGQVAIHLGGPAGPAAVPDVVLHARAMDLRFGKSLSYLPDRDADGRDDLLVGVPRSSEAATWAGAVLLFAGTASLDTIPDLVLLGENAGDEFGCGLSAGGDADGDGADDILVGAPFANPGGLTDAGRAYVFSGGAGLDATADLVLSGGSFQERFGTAVALGFDWDGDGSSDLAVGAPDRNETGPYSGGIDIHFGGTLLDTIPDVVIADADPDLHLGTTVTAGGDMLGNGDTTLCLGGYNAVNTGVVRLYGRDPAPVAGTPTIPQPTGRLAPPWPNPANPLVHLSLNLTVPGRWTVHILDLAGRRVATLYEGPLPAGTTTWRWDGSDLRGRAVGSGVYMVRAESRAEIASSRFTMVR